jgi:hypothetical protein
LTCAIPQFSKYPFNHSSLFYDDSLFWATTVLRHHVYILFDSVAHLDNVVKIVATELAAKPLSFD